MNSIHYFRGGVRHHLEIHNHYFSLDKPDVLDVDRERGTGCGSVGVSELTCRKHPEVELRPARIGAEPDCWRCWFEAVRQRAS
jgi:hypothetical protein